MIRPERGKFSLRLLSGGEEITGDLFEGYGIFPVRESEAVEVASEVLKELFSCGDPILIRERVMHDLLRKHSGMNVREVKILSAKRRGKKISVTVFVENDFSRGLERYVIGGEPS